MAAACPKHFICGVFSNGVAVRAPGMPGPEYLGSIGRRSVGQLLKWHIQICSRLPKFEYAWPSNVKKNRESCFFLFTEKCLTMIGACVSQFVHWFRIRINIFGKFERLFWHQNFWRLTFKGLSMRWNVHKSEWIEHKIIRNNKFSFHSAFIIVEI